ncbi:MAG: hypothetical protein GX361_09440 [Bacteroidales bacterium]|nr:hypothetical protein [Bacteroidales bacterium]
MKHSKFIIRFIFSVISFLTIINVPLSYGAENRVFRAGAAVSNITPLLGSGIIGEWTTPPASHVHDDLLARCLVLDDGSTELVFVVLDLLGIHTNLSDMAKKIIEQRLNIPPENIIISTTHTHSAASAMGSVWMEWNQYPLDEYQNYVISRIADVVQIAKNNLEPARIGWGVAKAPEHVFVRRWFVKEPVKNPFGGYDKVLTNPRYSNKNKTQPTTKPDPDVSFISVQSKDGRPIALFANYALHYIAGTGKGHISADYYGMFADYVSELINDKRNPKFVASMSNGASGNINNNDFSRPREKKKNYERINYVAKDIAGKVYDAYKHVVYHDWVPLGSQSEKITLKVRKPNQEMVNRAKKLLQNADNDKNQHVRERNYAKITLSQLKRPNQINIPLTTFKIGDLGIASIPFEVFVEIGLDIKARSPFKQTHIISLADGYHGYLPTPEQHELGGYETWLGTNNVEKEASVKIANQILKQFSDLQSN